MNKLNIGIIGATGIVGKEVIKLFEKSKNIYNINLYASDKSKNKEIKFNNTNLLINTTENILNDNLDYIFLVSSSDVSKNIVNKYKESKKNVVLIDNSSAFRLEKEIPLVIPEINLPTNNNNGPLLIANPNCCTVILCMLLYPLSKLSKLKQIDLSTYQSASGAGLEGLNELITQNKQFANNEILKTDYWNRQYIFNVFPHNSEINKNNLMNDEENKIILETRKILNQSELKINPTCIRVPTIRSHCEAVTVYFEEKHGKEEIDEIINRHPGIKNVEYCDTLTSSESSDIFVSRIRPNPNLIEDILDENILKKKYNSWNFFISGDQILKGAALNAYQIFKEYENI